MQYQTQKGFVIPTLVILISILVIGGGIYTYVKRETPPAPVNTTALIPTPPTTIPQDNTQIEVKSPTNKNTSAGIDSSINTTNPDGIDKTFSGTETTYINNFTAPIAPYVGEYAMVAELDFVQAKSCPGGEHHGPVPCVVNENPKVRYFYVRHDVKINTWTSDSKNVNQLMTLVKEDNAYAIAHGDRGRQWFTVTIKDGLITEINIDYIH